MLICWFKIKLDEIYYLKPKTKEDEVTKPYSCKKKKKKVTRLVTLPPFKKKYMKRIFIFASIFYTLLLLSNGDNDYSPSTTPDSDCSAIVYDVLDCIPYLSAESEQTKVDALCCSSFEAVLEISRECICVALKGSRELGLTLNIARAIALPSACGSSVLSFTDCDSKWDLSCFAF